MTESLSGLLEWIKSLGVLGHLLTFSLSAVTTALFFARYAASSRAELRRLQLQTRSEYAEELLKTRLEVYPELYNVISEFIKHVWGFRSGDFGYVGATGAQLSELSTKISDWDSKHAILMSMEVSGALWLLRTAVQQKVSSIPKEDMNSIVEEGDFKNIGDKMVAVELALKTDLGVFAVEEYLRLARPKHYASAEPKIA